MSITSKTEPVDVVVDEAELYRWFIPVACAYFFRHGGAGDERDLAHEAFAIGIAALRDERIRERERLGGFMLGVCRNLVRERARKDARTERAMRLATTNAAVEPDTAAREAGVDGFKLWRCVNALTARARAIIVSTFVDGLDAAAIADAQATSPGNVRVLRHRALTTLLKCMEEGGP